MSITREEIAFIGIIFFFVLLQKLHPWRKQQMHLRPQLALDITYTIINNFLIWRITKFIELGLQLPSRDYWQIFDLSTLSPFIGFGILLFIQDLQMYWIHRLLHRVDFLWRFHQVHHSALEIDVFNASRTHIFESILYVVLMYIPMGVIGFSANTWFLAFLVLNFFSLFTHSNARLPMGRLRFCFNSPEFHLWHHSKENHKKYGCNFGNALSLWDYIFGTAYFPKADTQFDLGFPGVEGYPRSFLGQLFEPIRTKTIKLLF